MLDFSWMDELTNQATERPTINQNSQANIDTPALKENRSEEATEGKRNRKAEKERLEFEKERERMREVYALHQENTKRAEILRCEINKGMKEGQDIKTLFLKALECISLMTGDSVIYEQNKAILKRDIM